MCTHQKWVYNRYADSKFLVKCGHCPACLQEKASKRASRIKAEYSPDRIVLFVTLTYDRCSCPFVKQSDIDKRLSVLPIYREFSTRRVRAHLPSGLSYIDKRHYGEVQLGQIYNPDYDSFDYRQHIRHLAYRSNNIGVCYYPDIQLFKKRLNINLKRKYNYDDTFKVFSTAEYGETTSRPHFHLLFFIRPCDQEIFRSAICEAWPFANRLRTAQYIEVARDCASYVASYVNSGVSVHKFLTDNFKAKHSYSKDFGVSSKLFTLDSILQKVSRRDLSYLRGVGPKGKEQYINFSIPKYVINRHFPVFKGYSRFTDTEVYDVLRSFIKQGTLPSTELNQYGKIDLSDFSSDDCHKISVRLRNAFTKYCITKDIAQSDASLSDYIYHYIDTWKIYKLTNLRLWYDDVDVPPKYRYDNSFYVGSGDIYSPDTKAWLDSSTEPYIPDPNAYPNVVSDTAAWEKVYYFRCKEKTINNYVMAQNNYYF